MKTDQKSLELAKLMGWEMHLFNKSADWYIIDTPPFKSLPLEPYSNDCNGLSQFAAIILKFPEVMATINYPYSADEKPTQESMLDEILLMNVIEI